jgi:hypothetical protein
MKSNWKCAVMMTVTALAFAVPALPSSIGTPPDRAARITTINEDGLVTATDRKGRAFLFRVTDAAVLRSLASGQQVMINATTGHVSVPGSDNCCTLVKRPAAPKL